MSHNNESFFSPSFDLIIAGKTLPYDLYINSSLIQAREKFVRLYPMGETLADSDLKKAKKKYHQFYIPEGQRHLYFKSITQSDDIPDEKKVEVLKDSAITYLDKIFDPTKEFSTEVLSETIEGCREAVESMIDVVHDHDIESLQNLIGKLSFHDFYTYDHSVNVSMYCISIYKTLKPQATKEELQHAGLGGLLHDLGKIKIPTEIINNPGKLSDDAFNEIKKHPGYGKELLHDSECTCSEGINLDVISKIIYQHHENFDGTGYPNKTQGENIHLLARITAIADFFDAVTTKRSYAETLTTEDAVNLMRKSVGKKIDPELFDLFTKHLKNITKKKSYYQIPDDFDPCQPHNQLPVEKLKVVKNEKKFGFFPKEEKKK